MYGSCFKVIISKFSYRTTSKVTSSYRALRDADVPNGNVRVKLTRSSSYAGTMNNPHDHLSSNYFSKVKDLDDFRRSGSNFDTFGYRYHSNALKTVNKGIVITDPLINNNKFNLSSSGFRKR